MHASNSLSAKNIKQGSDVLGFNKYNINNVYHNKKGKTLVLVYFLLLIAVRMLTKSV